MGETCQILRAIVLTMSKSFTISTIYRDSSGCGVSCGTSPLESVRQVRNTFNQGRPLLQNYAVILYDSGSAFHFRERFTDALHGQLDFVRRSDIDQEDVVLTILYQFTQSRLELGAAAARETALENGKLYPLAIPMHGFEHAPPALLVGDVIGHDEEAFVGHGARAHRGR